jgi:hypothetical protein
MTIAGQSAGHHGTVYAVVQRLEHQQYVELSSAGQLHDLDLWRVLHPQAAGQIGRCISAVLATIGNYL